MSFSTNLSFTDLPDIPGGWSTREVVVAERRFHLTGPSDPDAFLDDPATLEANRRDDFMPYWPYLWPAAISMAELVLRGNWIAETPTLEIGAGIGLVGLAALARGLRVTLSDYQQSAVDLAVHNARRNQLVMARGLRLDWRQPPRLQFPILFGCDVLYESRNHGVILDLLENMLSAEGVCWIGDPGRQSAGDFVESARARGFAVAMRDENQRPLANPGIGQFQLFVLNRE